MKSGKGLAVKVELNSIGKENKIEKQTFTTDKDGSFRAKVNEAGKYVLNIEKEGFALMSKVYYSPIQGLDLKLIPAYVATVNADHEINVKDTKMNVVPGIDSSKVQFKAPISQIPFVYNKGRLVGFELPESLKKAYSILGKGSSASGTQLKIPPKSLIDKNGKVVQGEVKVNISTINLLSDQMPGDYSVRMPGGIGYMISNGAASIEFYQNGEPLKLNGTATVSIPVDPTVLASGDSVLSDTIPFLSYDKELGEWYQEGIAKLNRESMSYEKEVRHFSAVNFDFLKKDWACIRIKPNIGTSQFTVYAVIPGQAPRPRLYQNPGSCTGANQNNHALLRLPPNTPIGVILIQGGAVVAHLVQFTGNFIPGSTTAVLACGTGPYAECVSTPEVYPPSSDVKPALIIKEVTGVTSLTTPPNIYSTSATTVTLAWVYNFTSVSGKTYVLRRMNDGETGFTDVESIPLTTSGSILQQKDVNAEGFTTWSEFKVAAYDGSTLLIESDPVRINW